MLELFFVVIDMNGPGSGKLKFKNFIILCIFSVYLPLFAQDAEKKILVSHKISASPKIDGILNDKIWEDLPAATDFVQLMPYNGRPAGQPSEVKIGYNDYAFYVGAMLYDSSPDSILKELSVRDEINISDYFGVYFDPFNDFQTAYGFFVTAAGVQVDIKSIGTFEEDETWNAVWKSQTTITDSGWIVELEIPHSALRFPKEEGEQVWGLQIFRNIMRYRQNTSWNFIDREVDGLNNQAGELHGISNIKPPLRLSVVPYLSGYVEKNPDNTKWATFYNYGLDLKYGINESFTLDMTLIPDFGQVQSDDVIYNLSPFEVYYDEKRPFFMEGTELFQRGDVFYSRRIGSIPSGYDAVEDSLGDNEKVKENPLQSQLINATKISGKTRKGLGMGLFNAMTANTHAIIEDTVSGESHKLLTEPFTNYNMVVFDQSLKNNSFFSVFNTNVYRHSYKKSANVSGTEFKFTDKSNTWSVFAQGAVSQQYNKTNNPEFGHSYFISAGKVSGKFTWELMHNVSSDTYDPNDMGFLRRNNEFENMAWLSYKMIEPRGRLLEWYNNMFFSYNFLYRPRVFTYFNTHISSRLLFRNHLTLWSQLSVNPINSSDYFEPRVEGRYYTVPPSFSVNMGYSPDYRKKFLVDLRGGLHYSGRYDQFTYNFSFEPRFRVNDKLMLIHEFEYQQQQNSMGYVSDSTDDTGNDVVIFGRRNLNRFENTLTSEYKFNNKSSLAFRFRHYWLTGIYKEYYTLLEDGSLEPAEYNEPENFSYNAFNIDMVYIWNFAPGSEINLVWKNSIYTFEQVGEIKDDGSVIEDFTTDFFGNLNNTLNSPSANSFSIKVLYYLDYQYLKKSKRNPSS
ncbi:MAG: carbohydrate binding family 9 domain-containing protein [Bacteroidales bacterium]|nr:carbohydrate binding family 9 domain-containing protein [Bacteroidales bacterium]